MLPCYAVHAVLPHERSGLRLAALHLPTYALELRVDNLATCSRDSETQSFPELREVWGSRCQHGVLKRASLCRRWQTCGSRNQAQGSRLADLESPPQPEAAQKLNLCGIFEGGNSA